MDAGEGGKGGGGFDGGILPASYALPRGFSMFLLTTNSARGGGKDQIDRDSFPVSAFTSRDLVAYKMARRAIFLSFFFHRRHSDMPSKDQPRFNR